METGEYCYTSGHRKENVYIVCVGGCCLISRGFPVATETGTGAWPHGQTAICWWGGETSTGHTLQLRPKGRTMKKNRNFIFTSISQKKGTACFYFDKFTFVYIFQKFSYLLHLRGGWIHHLTAGFKSSLLFVYLLDAKLYASLVSGSWRPEVMHPPV